MTDRPYLDDGDVVVYLADCVDAMRAMPADSVDAIVTDPPYGLEFMGKEWDAPWRQGSNTGAVIRDPAKERGGFQDGNGGNPYSRSRIEYGRGGAGESAAFQAWCEVWAREALRVAKPGAHLCAFGGTRTFHRLACAIEDAGWEVRDCAAWMYGSGFPKSLDVSKAIDKAACKLPPGEDIPPTPEGEAWAGWGTAMKPAWEPIIVARKPLVGTVAANVLAHGTGALNIDACRIGHANAGDLAASLAKNPGRGDKVTSTTYGADRPQQSVNVDGRWPANVALDEDAAAILDEQTGERPSGGGNKNTANRDNGRTIGNGLGAGTGNGTGGDLGGASRFFYTAKADREERQAPDGTRNTHPTVKPTDLMRWLVRLVTPPGGVVLDPFAGSGSTGVAARAEGFRAILVEREAEYASIIASRLAQQTLL